MDFFFVYRKFIIQRVYFDVVGSKGHTILRAIYIYIISYTWLIDIEFCGGKTIKIHTQKLRLWPTVDTTGYNFRISWFGLCAPEMRYSKHLGSALQTTQSLYSCTHCNLYAHGKVHSLHK